MKQAKKIYKYRISFIWNFIKNKRFWSVLYNLEISTIKYVNLKQLKKLNMSRNRISTIKLFKMNPCLSELKELDLSNIEYQT